jgi:PBSX family phage terminase large subunit
MEFGLFGEKVMRFILTPIEQDARINILEGSVRSGKTVGMIPKWINYIKNGPKGLLVITGISKETIFDNVLQDLFDTVGSDNYKYNLQTGLIQMFGRKIKVIGAKDEGSEKYLRGKTLAGAYCDELALMPEKFFKQLLNRLSVKGAKLYGTTNPDHPYHYLYTEYITDEKKLKSGMVKVYHFELNDNPNLDDEYKTFIRGAYTGFWYLRMIEGKWVVAQGAIYDMWDTDLNTFTDVDLIPGFKSLAQRYISCDVGTQNATVFLDCWDDGDVVWILDEYYHSGKKSGKQKEPSEYADDLEKFIGDEYPRAVIVDPSAAGFKVILRNRGLRPKDADNEVLEGLRLTATAIAKRKIRVHKYNCPNFLKEVTGYVWDEKAVMRGVEQPLKHEDHCMDSLRYYIKTIVKVRRLAE